MYHYGLPAWKAAEQITPPEVVEFLKKYVPPANHPILFGDLILHVMEAIRDGTDSKALVSAREAFMLGLRHTSNQEQALREFDIFFSLLRMMEGDPTWAVLATS